METDSRFSPSSFISILSTRRTPSLHYWRRKRARLKPYYSKIMRSSTSAAILGFLASTPAIHSFFTSAPPRVGSVNLWAKPFKVADWAQNAADDGVEGVVKVGINQEEPEFYTKEELKEQRLAAAAEKAAASKKVLRPPELFVKAGPSGDDVGDCPFAHAVRMVLAAKGVEYITTPCTPETKPQWLVEGYGGALPLLLHDDEATTESKVLTRYVDFFFPEPPLQSFSPAEEAACAPFFPALAAFLKSSDGDADDAAKRAALEEALQSLDAHLSTCPTTEDGTRFLSGCSSLGLGDCSLAPQLFHLRVAGKHFRNFEVPSQLTALAAYTDAMLAHSAFTQTMYPEETVIWGWTNARADTPSETE